MKRLLLAAAAVILAACNSAAATPTATPAATQAASSGNASGSSLTMAVLASASPTAAPANTLTVNYEENAQVELIASGHRILIDVNDPSRISKPVTADDILLTTHSHGDHYVPAFVDAFPGKKITFEQSTLVLDYVSVVSLPAAHQEGDALLAKDGSDYIFVIDFAGFRIAHFGDLGQDKLSASQLSALGKVDIAFSQLDNSLSTMDAVNKKGINQMNQLKPLVLVPTHSSPETAKLAAETWKATYSTKPLVITRDALPAETNVVFMGAMAPTYGKAFHLLPSAW